MIDFLPESIIRCFPSAAVGPIVQLVAATGRLTPRASKSIFRRLSLLLRLPSPPEGPGQSSRGRAQCRRSWCVGCQLAATSESARVPLSPLTSTPKTATPTGANPMGGLHRDGAKRVPGAPGGDQLLEGSDIFEDRCHALALDREARAAQQREEEQRLSLRRTASTHGLYPVGQPPRIRVGEDRRDACLQRVRTPRAALPRVEERAPSVLGWLSSRWAHGVRSKRNTPGFRGSATDEADGTHATPGPMSHQRAAHPNPHVELAPARRHCDGMGLLPELAVREQCPRLGMARRGLPRASSGKRHFPQALAGNETTAFPGIVPAGKSPKNSEEMERAGSNSRW